MSDRCPICNSPTYGVGSGNYYINSSLYNCYRCGKYEIDSLFAESIRKDLHDSKKIANISGWIREHQREFVDEIRYGELLELKTPTVAEKAQKLLKYISTVIPKPGDKIDIDIGDMDEILDSIKRGIFPRDNIEKAKKHLPLLSASWSEHYPDYEFIIDDYLYHRHQYISTRFGIRITVDGWTYLESLKEINPDSQIAFIAMWFDERTKPLFMEIEKGVYDSGYNPIRVDRHEHVNKIDDEIISLIKQSKFIVADYTGQRGGVYFESGYALGLGLNVIWLCEEKDKKKLHFDTSHYNFLFWEEDKLENLKIALTRRIEAVIGKGNYKQE